jgi:hypothetical protein
MRLLDMTDQRILARVNEVAAVKVYRDRIQKNGMRNGWRAMNCTLTNDGLDAILEAAVEIAREELGK